MLIINILVSFFALIAVFFITYIYGRSFVYLCNYNKKKFINYNILLLPIIGFCMISIISNFLFFFLNLKIDLILLVLLFLLIFFLLYIKKEDIFNNFLVICFKVFPIILVFLFFILIQGEQFYIFRGNYWDNANYISQAIVIKDNTFQEILKIRNNFHNFDNINYNSSYLHLGSSVILTRPNVGLLLAFFLKLNLINYFFLNNLFKIFLLGLIFLSIYTLVSKFILKNAYFVASTFIFSFWSLFIYDQEALSHFATISIFISIVIILLETGKKNFFDLKYNYILFLILNISFFLIYPEFFSVYLIFLFFFILCKYKISLFFLNNYKNILLISLFFFIITLPAFSTNYLFLFEQTKESLSFHPPDFWGYYGMFLVGKDRDFLNADNIMLIKTLVATKYNFLELFKSLLDIFLKSDYFFIPFNIIPSFFGLYYLTISVIHSKFDLLILFFVFLLNFYLIKIILRNFKYILNNNSNLIIIFQSFFITFFLFLFLLLFFKNFWGIIKLYLYFSPIIFLFTAFYFNNNSTKKFNFNMLFCILIIIFPIYKFSQFNNGIGRQDTFPSIIKSEYKNNINWSVNSSIFSGCHKIKIASNDTIIIRYLSIKLNYYNYKFNNGIYEKKYNNQYINNNVCIIKLANSYFVVNDPKTD